MLIAMVAFAVDFGWIFKVRTDMQRSADAAALAAVQDLIPAVDGSQDLNSARAAVRNYVRSNLKNASFKVVDDDIQIGRYDPSQIYSNVTLLNSGTLDAVRVTLRRDGAINPRVALFFARALGIMDANVTVTATAVLQKPTLLIPGAKILPIAIHADVWNGQDLGDTWSVYGDGRIEDEYGHEIPGNWGSVDIGATSNSTSDLVDQILNGLRQDDLDDLYADERILQDAHINGSEKMWVQSDTGFSAGMKSAIRDIQGLERLVPIYAQVRGASGNNVEFQIVSWGVVTVVDSRWHGGKHSYIQVQKSYMYDGHLGTQPNSLSNSLDTPGVITGAFSSPVLVE